MMSYKNISSNIPYAVKLVAVLLIFGLFTFYVNLLYTKRLSLNEQKQFIVSVTNHGHVGNVKYDSWKYILMWTNEYTEPFNFLKIGHDDFTRLGCEYNNCYLTHDKTFLEKLDDFDAVLFHAPEYTFTPNKNYWKHPVLKRSNHEQIFVFVCIESSSNYPICDNYWNSYFNMTMTYKTDSDIYWGYVNVRDKSSGKVIGPKDKIDWNKNMQNVDQEFKKRLKTKSKAVAWFVSNCQTLSKREKYTEDLQKELKNVGLYLDVYGKCGDKKCPLDKSDVCFQYLKNDYFFYLSFENSFSIDYTTEKLLTALRNSVVPIVWSGSNHTRFMPPGSYIDARTRPPKALAADIKRIMNNSDEYASYFKWRNHYTYHKTMENYETHPMCALCKALNDPGIKAGVRVKDDLKSWWNGADAKC